jgi:HlyD family secretion protein
MPPQPKTNRATPLVIWGLSLAVVLLAVYVIHSITGEKVSVVTTRASYGDLIKSFTTNGKVEPIEDFQAHAQAAGQVQEIYVSSDQKVKAGQLLLRMDDKYALANLAHANSTLQAAQLAASDVARGGTLDERNTYAGDLSRAKLQLQQDSATLAARQQLQKQGAASAGEVAGAQHSVEVDETNIKSIEQHSTQRYGQADLARAQAELADARAAVAAAQSSYNSADIRTPISGTVYYLPVAQYDYVGAGEELVYVADLSRLQVTAYFDEPDIGGLANGQPVTITWEANPGMTWHGHISEAPTTVITYGTTRNVGECVITVDDAKGDLKPNATVLVKVTTAQHLHVLIVPHEAVHFDSPQPYVYRVVHERLVRTPVKLDGGIANPQQVEITGGLDPGDVIALNATINRELTNGLEVKSISR